jgi:hypothetical protein
MRLKHELLKPVRDRSIHRQSMPACMKSVNPFIAHELYLKNESFLICLISDMQEIRRYTILSIEMQWKKLSFNLKWGRFYFPETDIDLFAPFLC